MRENLDEQDIKNGKWHQHRWAVLTVVMIVVLQIYHWVTESLFLISGLEIWWTAMIAVITDKISILTTQISRL